MIATRILLLPANKTCMVMKMFQGQKTVQLVYFTAWKSDLSDLTCSYYYNLWTFSLKRYICMYVCMLLKTSKYLFKCNDFLFDSSINLYSIFAEYASRVSWCVLRLSCISKRHVYTKIFCIVSVSNLAVLWALRSWIDNHYQDPLSIHL